MSLLIDACRAQAHVHGLFSILKDRNIILTPVFVTTLLFIARKISLVLKTHITIQLPPGKFRIPHLKISSYI